MPNWLTVDRPGGVHVLPINDIVEHRESPSCVCAPRVSLCDVQPHGRYQFVRQLVVHEAMDGRE